MKSWFNKIPLMKSIWNKIIFFLLIFISDYSELDQFLHGHNILVHSHSDLLPGESSAASTSAQLHQEVYRGRPVRAGRLQLLQVGHAQVSG